MEKKPPSAEAKMLIRRDAATVFNAFMDPTKTRNFWFTKGSDKLEVNKEVVWTWEMFNFSAKAKALEIIPNQKIVFDWYAGNKSTQVNINFNALNPESTFVSVVHSGFESTGDELVAELKDSAGGFALVLAGLKAYLEHDINLNLVADSYPKELTDHEAELKEKTGG